MNKKQETLKARFSVATGLMIPAGAALADVPISAPVDVSTVGGFAMQLPGEASVILWAPVMLLTFGCFLWFLWLIHRDATRESREARREVQKARRETEKAIATLFVPEPRKVVRLHATRLERSAMARSA